MPVDPSKLRSAVRRLAKGTGSGKGSLGITASIRKLLPDIQRLREDEGASWRVIAAALAEQGVTEGEGKPLTERRLTSIITKLKAQDKAKAKTTAERAGRSDVVSLVAASASGTDTSAKDSRPRPQLAPELKSQQASPEEEPPLSEDEIRRSQRDKHAHLVRKE